MNIIKDNLRQYGLLIALVGIAIFFQVRTGGVIFLPNNITNLILQNSYILILAIGMTLVIVTGRIDLSVGSVVAFSGALSGVFIVEMGWPVWVAILICLVAGAVIGAFHGFLIAYINIPFFVVTLAGMLGFRGLTMIILDGRMIGPFPAQFQMMAAGFVPDFFNGSNFNITAVAVCALLCVLYIFSALRKRRIALKYGVTAMPIPFLIASIIIVTAAIALFGYWFGAANGIPNIVVLLGVLILIYTFLTNRTMMGRHIYACGSNAKASELSGVKTKQVVFWVYVSMGVLAALAGLVFTARLNAAMPRAGTGFELQAIAAAFIGGASPSGGVGKVTGAIIGAMVVGIITNGMSILGISLPAQQMVTGMVLLAAVIFDVVSKNNVLKLRNPFAR
ncbi:MAG: sugar ABC transporter permease [Oscillospiraceae bacterium]|nr:sugar ABC transporter permease [Oscillospiraceae bacterium]